MSPSALADVRNLAEEFESGGWWSCRQLNKWVLVSVTLAFGFSLGADVFYEATTQHEVPLGLLVAGVLAVGCVILLWACVTYAVPAGLAVLCLSLFVDGIAYAVSLALVLTALTAQTATRTFRRSTFVLMVIWAALSASTVDDAGVGTGFFLGLSLALLGAYGIGSAFRHATTARHQSRADMHTMQRRHEESVTAERQSIARDLHDMVAHDITIIAMQSRAAQLDGSPDVLRESLEVIGKSSRAALQDLRRMLALLHDEDSGHWDSARSATASELDLRDGCEVFAQRLSSLGFTVHTSLSGDLGTVSRSVSAALYRILQECTTNVVKYAGDGAHCWIEVEVGPERVAMCVTNTLETSSTRALETAGRSADWRHSGAGLIGVQDRARAFGGTAESGVHEGTWRVRVGDMKKA